MNKDNVHTDNCNVDKRKSIVIFSIISSIYIFILFVVFGCMYIYQSLCWVFLLFKKTTQPQSRIVLRY